MLPKISSMFRLVKDPEFKEMSNGVQLCSLYLAASEKYKDKETKLFINAVAFSKTAEFISQVQKGQRVFITGKIQTEQWETNGERKSKISMVVESFEYVEKREPQQNAQQGQYAQPQSQRQQYAQTSQLQCHDSDMSGDNDIPF